MSGQLIDNALLESRHRVVVESPHHVKSTNGLPESIWVRQAGLTYLPADIDVGNAPSWVATIADYTHWRWRDTLALSPGGSALGDAGDAQFYSDCLASLNALTLTNHWAQNYQFRSVNAHADPPTDSTVWTNYMQPQFVWNFNGAPVWNNAPPHLAGTAMSGWSIYYGYLAMARAQARYAGGRLKIPYWSGRCRWCFEYGGWDTAMRIDVTDSGWKPVVDGELLVTVPMVSSVPFPLQRINNSIAATTYYALQAITLDVNFTILASDPSSCSMAWGMPFGVWMDGNSRIPGNLPSGLSSDGNGLSTDGTGLSTD